MLQILNRLLGNAQGETNGTEAGGAPQVVPEGDDNPQDVPQVQEGFTVGEHVYIENTIRHIIRRRPTPADRALIVQRIAGERIYITTYNGHYTWRKSNHLRRLTTTEQANIQ